MDLCTAIVPISLLLIFGATAAFGFVGPEERKCKYLRVDRLLKIRCHDMNLKEVPPYLKSSVEVLDLSFNRIKKLRRSSFQPYKSLQYLLLYENMIQSVEPGTFEHLTALQEIDLSNNALMTIPLELFQLPSLRNLYVDSNELFHLERDLEVLETPIRAPLEYLNVADCGLEDIPDLGILPKLWHLNASMNPLTELRLERFAAMCHLKSIDLTRTQLSQCACQQVNNHLRHLAADTKFVPVCIEALGVAECPLPYNRTIGSETFRKCQTSVSRAEARNMWLFTAGCVGGILTVLLMVWYCLLRRRRKRRLKRLQAAAASRKNFVISPKNAINNKHPHPPPTQTQRQSHRHPNEELLCCDTT